MEKQLQEDLELILGDELGQLRDKRRSERLESVLESVQALESESSELRTEIDIAGARVHKARDEMGAAEATFDTAESELIAAKAHRRLLNKRRATVAADLQRLQQELGQLGGDDGNNATD